MRQLLFQVPRGQGAAVLSAARELEGQNLACFPAHDGQGLIDVAIVHVLNNRVEPLLERLQEIAELRVTLVPREFLTLRPPPEEAARQAVDIAFRSPVEVFLSGLQSVGSWKGFLGYAAASGVVAWVGLATNTVFLLTASMLIAPFAGPAMNAALATARGDGRLLARTLTRYFASLAVGGLTAWILSLIFGLQTATSQMTELGAVSGTAALLPLVAGAAGALNIVQSDRSSLVSSTATGVLVAASLAPPVALLGMALALPDLSLVRSGLFQLLLQLAGINLAAAVVFRLAGLSARGARYARGRRGVAASAWGTTLVALVLLLAWQFSRAPQLQRASAARRAVAVIQATVERSGLGHPVEVNARFPRANMAGQETLLATIYVQEPPRAAVPAAQAEREIAAAVRRQLQEEGFPATALVDVTVLAPSP